MVNAKPVQLGKNTRMSFAKIKEVLEMPNLIEVQIDSYKWFLEEGLKEVFRDIESITDHNGVFELSFVDYKLDDEPKYSIKECKERDATYAAPLRVRAQLLNRETGEIRENEIFMGDFPLMTDYGTFVINGAERVIVSQLVRSPGIYFSKEIDKTGKDLFNSTIIPNRGAWIEYETDHNDVMYTRIDKNRKLPMTTFARVIGLETNAQIIEMLGESDRLAATLEKDTTENRDDALLEVYKKLRPGEPFTVEGALTHIYNLFFEPRRYDISRVGRYKYNKKFLLSTRLANHTLSRPIADPLTGEILAEEGEIINREKAVELERKGVSEAFITVEYEGEMVERKILTNGMVDAKYFVSFDPKECGINEMVSFEVLREILENAENEDAIKEAFELRRTELVPNTVTKEDIYASMNYICGLPANIGNIDDIDHLGNRRIRSVGELLQNQFRIGFSRMERLVREKMNLQVQDTDNISPQSIINIRPVVSAIREFFGSSPLSQFMDQGNPLAELTHKRRLSALGPGGLSRDRAGFEVRDVHYSHYGRMCSIETPEGPNIGLISHLATYAKINEYGFIEAPYRKIDKATGVVTDEVVYMTADEEDEFVVAQANEPLDEEGRFKRQRINCRYRDEFLEIENSKADYMDVSPKMIVSVATAMIPFLENDDANRALMGSNMQRQAVPLLVTESPVVGTGMEYKAAVDSGVTVIAKEDGVVKRVSATEIVVTNELGVDKKYELIKFTRSNQGTCFNQKPIVNAGDVVKVGDVIADGPATDNGEIALGKNMLIGFMTWEGYNYEDAVLLNENLVKYDKFTSIHIEEFETEARETKLGAEEITRDIPNVGELALKDLDERGIIRIGAEVTSGDILVGKVTPKGESEQTAEERLLRAIFGEKAKEVRDTSLRVPHGQYGTVVDVKVFTRENSSELNPGVNMVVRCYIAQKRKISVGDKMAGRHGNKGVVSRILPQEDMPFLPDGTPLDIVLNPLGVPSRMNIGQVLEVHLGYAAKALGWKICTNVFDGAKESDIRECLKEAGYAEDGKTQLFDGRTGLPFDNRVTVGYMYFLKLHHLVDDKIHARSTGPYSLVTQQPLGGKAQFGGQRFGEMEVWALEAYGAAYTLQEILTVKSDDVDGRVKTFESIVKGKNVPKAGIPESFKVLIKELQSLALDIQVLDADDNEIDLKQVIDDDNDFTRTVTLSSENMPMDSETVVDGLEGYGVQDEDGEYVDDADDFIEADDFDEDYGDGDIDDVDYADNFDDDNE